MNVITYNPNVLGGKPIIKGTRISVDFILERLASGMTPEEIHGEYPKLTRKVLQEVFNFAAQNIKRADFIPAK